ncbi:MAG: hypothetical protein WB543_10520 [Candidatus Acidiferrum sp.]
MQGWVFPFFLSSVLRFRSGKVPDLSSPHPAKLRAELPARNPGKTGRFLVLSSMMARLARIAVVHVRHHVTQRGNALQFLLASDTECLVYLELLRHYAALDREHAQPATAAADAEAQEELFATLDAEAEEEKE